MTVGIGILNRSGVVLAADTFDAVEGFQTMKSVSVNRIFPLSKYHPVGIMLDRSVRFMDAIPWEAIIEVYSSYIRDKSFNTLQEYAEDFINFLPNDKRFYCSSAEMNIIKLVLNYCIDKVKNTVKNTVNFIEDYEKAISDEVEKEIIFYSKESFFNTFDDNFIKLFLEKHRENLEKCIKDKADFNIDIKTQENLILMCVYVISKSDYMINHIDNGRIVISGYGDKEIFPSLYQYNIVGTINGKLIYKLMEHCNIETEEDMEKKFRKKIIPFGEKDLINTYINGINPDLEEKILQLTKKIFDDFLKGIQNEYNKNDVLQQFIDKEKDKIKNVGIMVVEVFEKYIKYLKEEISVKPLLDMVDDISKADMIFLAEALVNLTSISVKFKTNEKAEVGPIDVAFITKGGGFEWIKRREIFNLGFNDINVHTANSK